MHAAEFAQHVQDAVMHGNEWLARCPAHDDNTPSLAFRDSADRVLIRCHAGCAFDAIVTACGLQARNLFFDDVNASGTNGSGQSRHIAAIYPYTDEQCSLIFEVVRYEPKQFRQRQPDGNGGWIWNLQGVARVPYRLPILATDYSHPICFHEGEKACEAALAAWLPGVHTTTSGGASNCGLSDLSVCGGREVLVIPDNDEAGRRYAESLSSRLIEIGAVSVRIVTLPNLPPHGDVVEWLAAGGTPEQFAALCQAAPLYNTTTNAPPPEPNPAAPAPPEDDRHELDADIGDLAEITRQALHVLVAHNDPPTLFLYGGMPVRLEVGEEGRPKPVELTIDRLRHESANAGHWTKKRNSPFGVGVGRDDTRPPVDVVKNMLATPDLPFPRLKAIVEVPVVARDGRIISQPGYDAPSGIFYEPYTPNLDIQIPEVPTPSDLAEAKALLDEMIGDFAFVGDADRAHALALAFGPFCRDLIEGPTPLHDFEAPSPGTGKNLLVESLLFPAVGYNTGLVAEARDEEEWRKRLTARFREARPVLVIDNLSKPLNSGVLSAALTARQWDDRLLGKSETISLPVRTMWALTSNNPVFSMEIARRCIRIRLDARTDRPWLREGFRHPDLRRWVEAHRADLIAAILTIVRAWLHTGRPGPSVKPLGSYESWSHVIGGIVTCAGYPGFLGNVLELYETADTEGRTWRLFVEQWWATHQSTPVTVADLFTLAEGIDGFYLGKTTTERGQKTSLGRQIKKRRDQMFDQLRIEEAGTFGGSAQWRLQVVAHSAVPEPVAEEVNIR